MRAACSCGRTVALQVVVSKRYVGSVAGGRNLMGRGGGLPRNVGGFSHVDMAGISHQLAIFEHEHSVLLSLCAQTSPEYYRSSLSYDC